MIILKLKKLKLYIYIYIYIYIKLPEYLSLDILSIIVMDKLNNKNIINNIFDFVGEKTCPISDIPETFYLKTCDFNRRQIDRQSKVMNHKKRRNIIIRAIYI